jgi:hypothetical protein
MRVLACCRECDRAKICVFRPVAGNVAEQRYVFFGMLQEM